MTITESPSFLKKSKDLKSSFSNSFDVLILGDRLESYILMHELKARALRPLLIELNSFPKLKDYEDYDSIQDPYENFCPSFDFKKLYEMQFKNLKKKIKTFNSLETEVFSFNSPLKGSKQSLNQKSNIEVYFHSLFKNLKFNRQWPPFFGLNRILSFYLKNHLFNSKDYSLPLRLKNREISSFEFEKGNLSSVLLTSGERIFTPWVIFCLSPRLLVYWMKKGVTTKGDSPFSKKFLSKLARFKAWGQVTLVLTHRWNSEGLSLNRTKGGNETKGESDDVSLNKEDVFILSHRGRFCGGYLGEPYQRESLEVRGSVHQQKKGSFLRKSCWMSLISFEAFEDRKLLRQFVLSMKKQIFKSWPHFLKAEDVEEEILLIEPESHGFLEAPFSPSFGLLKGAKNFFFSSSLFSCLPPPLNAFESARKTLDSLLFFISNKKK